MTTQAKTVNSFDIQLRIFCIISTREGIKIGIKASLKNIYYLSLKMNPNSAIPKSRNPK